MKRKSSKNKANNYQSNTASIKSVSSDPAETIGEHYLNVPFNVRFWWWMYPSMSCRSWCRWTQCRALTKSYHLVDGVTVPDEERNIMQGVLAGFGLPGKTIAAPTLNNPDRRIFPSREQKMDRREERKADIRRNDRIIKVRAAISRILTEKVTKELRDDYLIVCKKKPLHFWFLLKQRHSFYKISYSRRKPNCLTLLVWIWTMVRNL